MTKQVLFSTRQLLGYARRGTLLLGLAGLAPTAMAQVTFSYVRSYTSAGRGPSSVAVQDLNGDGAPDIVVINSSIGSVGVLLGTGTGTFPEATLYATGGTTSGTSGVAIGDLNGDGKPDIVTANPSDDGVGVLLGTGTGTFRAPTTTYSTGSSSHPVAIALGDLNNDGRLDLVTANSYRDAAGVLLGRGTGGFAAVTIYPTGSNSPRAVAVGDVNADGKLDILLGCSNGSVGVLLNNGAGGFPAAPTFYPTGGKDVQDLAVGELTADGKVDVVVADATEGVLRVLPGTGTGGFGTATVYFVGNSNSSPNGVALGDFNKDGRLDLVSANYNINSVGVLLGRRTGGFPSAATLYSTSSNSGPNDVVVADVNNDTKPDIITANFIDGAVGVLLNTTVLATNTKAALTAERVSVYPNPAQAAFTVEVPAVAGAAAVQAELRNTLGQLVARQRAPLPAGGTHVTITTAGLAAGVYTLHLQAGDQTLARRVVLY